MAQATTTGGGPSVQTGTIDPLPNHSPADPTDVDVLLYDGVCALCNGLVRFLVEHDRDRRFRYAALQSEFARAALAPYGEDPTTLSTVFLLQNFGRPDQRCLRRSRAALAALGRLGRRLGALSRASSACCRRSCSTPAIA